MQFCRFVASVYPHMPTNFGLFILIFNKMVLIFLAVLIVFYRFEFPVANDEWSQFTQPQSTGLCWSLNTSCNRSQNQLPSFKMHIGICLGNNPGNFQLHRFTTSENITKSFGGFFDYTEGFFTSFFYCHH